MPGTPCHITQRGNNQQDVFFVDDDRGVYLELLRKSAQQFGLAVHGYCLMANHVHLVAARGSCGSGPARCMKNGLPRSRPRKNAMAPSANCLPGIPSRRTSSSASFSGAFGLYLGRT